jgi:hypothetical protein
MNCFRSVIKRRKAKDLITPLKMAIVRAAKAVGKSEPTAKIVHRGFANVESSGEEVSTSRKIRRARRKLNCVISGSVFYIENV